MGTLKEKSILGKFRHACRCILTGTLTAATISVSMAQEPCENALEKAVELFDVKDYPGVVDKFINCSFETYEGPQKKRADHILAASTNSVFSDDKGYDRVIQILSKYPVAELEIEEAHRTLLYEALGESYLKKGGLTSDAAQQVFGDLARLTLDGKYVPGEHKLSPQFMENLTQAQRALTAKSDTHGGSGLKWVLVGGGAVVAGITAAFLLSGGGAERLPGPPGPPERP